MKISFAPDSGAKTIIIPVFQNNVLGETTRLVETLFPGNPVVAALENNEKGFFGKRGQVHKLDKIGKSGETILCVGMGSAATLDEAALRTVSAPLYKALAKHGDNDIAFWPDETQGSRLSAAEMGVVLADALRVQDYSFDKYKTLPTDKYKIGSFSVSLDDDTKAKVKYKALKLITDSKLWAADLVNEPSNKLNPDTYAARIQEELEPLGIIVRILDSNDMNNLGMKAALAVGQGSATANRMVVMEYKGSGKKNAAPLALVGKGMTYDSGGYSIKPSKGMMTMHMDMGGSAAVVGAMRSIALRNAQADVVAIVALAENMIGPDAYRPGDIISSMKGLSIEVENTDAEGRLVLADALTYIQREYKPHTIIDIATLTGAAAALLGPNYTGVFSNTTKLWDRLQASGAAVGEEGKRLELAEKFSKAVRGDRSDIRNATMEDRRDGAHKAAAFLRYFIDKNEQGKDKCQWAHLDIAGTVAKKGEIAYGYGVRWLDRLIADYYEPKAPGKKAPVPQP